MSAKVRRACKVRLQHRSKLGSGSQEGSPLARCAPGLAAGPRRSPKVIGAKERNAGLQLEPRLATGAKTMLWLRAVAQEQAQDEAPLGQTSRAVHVLHEKGLALLTLARVLVILRFLASALAETRQIVAKGARRPSSASARSPAAPSLRPAVGGCAKTHRLRGNFT